MLCGWLLSRAEAGSERAAALRKTAEAIEAMEKGEERRLGEGWTTVRRASL